MMVHDSGATGHAMAVLTRLDKLTSCIVVLERRRMNLQCSAIIEPFNWFFVAQICAAKKVFCRWVCLILWFCPVMLRRTRERH